MMDLSLFQVLPGPTQVILDPNEIVTITEKTIAIEAIGVEINATTTEEIDQDLLEGIEIDKTTETVTEITAAIEILRMIIATTSKSLRLVFFEIYFRAANEFDGLSCQQSPATPTATTSVWPVPTANAVWTNSSTTASQPSCRFTWRTTTACSSTTINEFADTDGGCT
jgi:hypothetical protein